MQIRRVVTILKALFFFVVIGTPLFYYKWSIYPYIVPKSIFFQIVVEIIFFLWLALAIIDRRYRPKMTPIIWGIVAYIAMLTIATFTGIDPLRSLFSGYERAFGVVVWYHLAALVIVVTALSHELPWKKLWYASFAASIATVLGALIQLGDPNFFLLNDLVGASRPGSTFGNPTFLAGYLLLNIFIAIYYLFPRHSRDQARTAPETVFLVATLAVDIVGIFVTQTRGDILGLFAGIFALLLVLAWRPPAVSSKFFRGRSTYVAILVVFIAFSGFVWITRNYQAWDAIPGFDRLKEVSLSYEGNLAPRLMAYSAAWKGFLEKPIFGWGPENFNVIFSKHYDPRALEFGYTETSFDKPHSVPLEELVSGGVGLLLAYLALFILLIREAWRSKNDQFFAVIIAVAAAYFVRSSVVFDTLGTAFTFYLILGFTSFMGKTNATERALPEQAAKAKPSQVAIFCVAAIPAIAAIYILNLSSVSASYHSFWGHVELQLKGDAPAAMIDFRRAVDPWSPYRWAFVRDYANTIAQAYFYDHGLVSADDVRDAIGRMQTVTAAHPDDAYNHYLLADIYNLVSDIDPQKYLPMAEAEEQAALVLSPGRQEILFYLAKTKSLEGDNAAALKIAKQALDEDPKVTDSHFYYGMLAFALGQSDVGYREVKFAQDSGRGWHNFYEARVAGDYFADAGHLYEAIELYKAALILQPGDLEAEIKLGAAYFINGEPNLARPYLRDAASRFDFTKSPQYPEYKPILDSLGIQTGGSASLK